MALSNRLGSLVLATGNKSEYAVGYATLYGDMAGGFAPIKDVPKTLVYELVRWRNAAAVGRRDPADPATLVDKPPSAELRPDQRDRTRSRPTTCSTRSSRPTSRTIWAWTTSWPAGRLPRTAERIATLIDRAEYKRRQSAPGVKITPKAFGRDRRLPITNRYPDR